MLEKQATRALRLLNKSIKKVFGLENLAQVIYQIAAIENIFRSGFGLEPETIDGEVINNFPEQSRSSLREYWAKYLTLKYFESIGTGHIMYKNIILKKIPSEGIAWKLKS